MKKPKKQIKKTLAVKQSWLPGGARRIAYEKRMQQDKKTSSLVDQTGDIRRLMEDQRTSQPAAKVIGHPKAEIASEWKVIGKAEMACEYYRAACHLLLRDNPDFRKPAEHLIAQADDILGGHR